MKYIFLHIPKNGGTTLQQIVDDQYPKYRIYNILDHERAERLKQLKEKGFLAKKFIKVVKGGHFSYGCHTFFKNPDQVTYFAMLRHPVDRALSYYSYVKRTPEHYLYKTFTSENITLDDFIEREDLNMEVTNGQTKLLGGFGQKETCTSAIFEMAMEHLEHTFFLVGIMERYVETLFMLKTILGWSRPIHYNMLNVNSEQKNELSKEQHKKLLELNKFDMAIYKYGIDTFENRFRSFPESDFNNFKNNLQS